MGARLSATSRTTLVLTQPPIQRETRRFPGRCVALSTNPIKSWGWRNNRATVLLLPFCAFVACHRVNCNLAMGYSTTAVHEKFVWTWATVLQLYMRSLYGYELQYYSWTWEVCMDMSYSTTAGHEKFVWTWATVLQLDMRSLYGHELQYYSCTWEVCMDMSYSTTAGHEKFVWTWDTVLQLDVRSLHGQRPWSTIHC